MGTWEGGDLGDEEHNKDHEELPPNQELLDLLWGVNQRVALHSTRELLGVRRHIPLLHSDTCIMQSLNVSQQDDAEEQDNEIEEREQLQHTVVQRYAHKHYQQQ